MNQAEGAAMTELKTREGVTVPDVKCERCGYQRRPWKTRCPKCEEEKELRDGMRVVLADLRPAYLDHDSVSEIMRDETSRIPDDFWAKRYRGHRDTWGK